MQGVYQVVCFCWVEQLCTAHCVTRVQASWLWRSAGRVLLAAVLLPRGYACRMQCRLQFYGQYMYVLAPLEPLAFHAWPANLCQSVLQNYYRKLLGMYFSFFCWHGARHSGRVSTSWAHKYLGLEFAPTLPCSTCWVASHCVHGTWQFALHANTEVNFGCPNTICLCLFRS